MKAKRVLKIFFFLGLLRGSCSTLEGTCSREEGGECGDNDAIKEKASNKYSQESNTKWAHHLAQIEEAVASYKSCDPEKCSCHYPLIKKDLAAFKNGINKDILQSARDRGTFYQIINHKLFREKNCMFPSRCSGIEHFILKIIDKLPDLEMVVNTRDWPQVDHRFGRKLPVFSFSKTSTYLDITYPAWTFWEGGPAIGLYPMGLGRWDLLRKSLHTASERWPWDIKESKGFFRGSRTSAERDPLVYLSREKPDLVDAQYTKNQAWKSDADTLYAPPASEVPLEDHCQYKYLFNFRGVAASFRFKHLFLCRSLVFHSGDEWIEFFYPRMKPWVHYIPVRAEASKEEIRKLLEFAKENDDVSSAIAERGYEFIRDHLRMKDVLCYWKKLLQSYAELLQYKPVKEAGVFEVRPKL
ncbi:O-glucosyltransferase rumi homolog [Penaeus japonicus]|uniref:O-glucosyltransferase rumi homolog n=1 Tax=Penaeus japonicus TaxID=27405 RepID=UPI001C70E647|nr:O-glucosyltransferase rumi homolog [Penaeus japonicus]